MSARVYSEVRDAFFEELYELAVQDRDVLMLTADQGALSFEKFGRDIPQQFIKTGIAEQNLIGVAAGLALTGKAVFAHAIIPFLTMRCFEHIRVDLCCMNLPVTLVGIGAGYAYNTDGPTHHAVNDIAILRALPGMQIWNPSDLHMIASLVPLLRRTPGPKYIRLDKGSFPSLYGDNGHDFSAGVHRLRAGTDVILVATGIMVHQALRVAEELSRDGIAAGVVDLYRLKPVNADVIWELLEGVQRVVTLEENSIVGGLGTVIAELICDAQRPIALRRLALADQFRFELGSREALQALDGLDVPGVTRTIKEWMS